MRKKPICLASDNYTEVHPAVLESLSKVNQGSAPSYGADFSTAEAQRLIQTAFASSCKVFITPSGTGANVFALKLALRRHESVLCTDIAHINYQESGAAEYVIGCKLIAIPHENGKLTPQAVVKRVKIERAFGKHSTSPRVLSITQPTEFGTVYTLDELQALSRVCKEENLLLHIDGSRIYNAAAFLNVPLSAITQAASVDILALGGTKNGLMCAEAVCIFNKNLEEGSDCIHKQTLQLVSKMRYLSAQFIPFFNNELWRTLALQANVQAQKIAAIIAKTPGCTLSFPVQTNQIFFTVPAKHLSVIQENIQCYVWDNDKNEIRFVTSWNTSDEDVEAVRALLCGII